MSVLFGEATFVRARVTAREHPAVARFLRFAIPAALIAAPAGFGATTVAGSIALVAVSWLLLLTWMVDGIGSGRLHCTPHPVALPVVLLLAFTAVHWATQISVVPLTTRLEWLRWVGYAALAWVAVESFSTPRRLRRLAKALAVGGFLVAGFAIVQYLTSNGKIYWWIEPAQGGWIFGPYVNRNHFAGLMELWIPLALGLALMPQNSMRRRWFWCALALVMGIAVMLSGSRGGTLVVAIELLFLALATAALRGGRRVLIGLVLAMLLAGGAAWKLDQTQVFERYKQVFRPHILQQEEASSHRLEAWRGCLVLFRQHWLIGSGLDTFGKLFPGVRSFSTDLLWTQAHNDFLQFLAETGVVGAILGVWILGAGGREVLRNLSRARGTATCAVLVGVASGCLGFMAHGWLDFNFHVPANAANFAVLAAVLTRSGWSDE